MTVKQAQMQDWKEDAIQLLGFTYMLWFSFHLALNCLETVYYM